MNSSRDELAQLVESEIWFHSIDLGQGIITKGQKTSDSLAKELEALRFPNLREKTVLDIGAFDGFYSFEAERRGAKRVVALDHHVWEYETRFSPEYFEESRKRGFAPAPPYQTEWLRWEWKPQELPGKRRFDLARQALDSKVEPVVADFMKIAVEDIGTFDIVFFLGVLYHMQNPLEAMRRVAAFTNELAIIETEAVALPGLEHRAFCEFFESNELNGDYSNWWSPNEKAIHGMCRAAGFRHVETVQGPSKNLLSQPSPPSANLRDRFWRKPRPHDNAATPNSEGVRYRAIVHAQK